MAYDMMLNNDALAAFTGAMLGVVLIIGLITYIYTSIALMTIGKKLKYSKPWLAWIPIANFAMVLQMGGFHWAWVFLTLGALIPILNIIAIIAIIILSVIAFWRIAEKRNFPGWTVLLVFIPFIGGLWQLIFLGILAWKE